MINGLKYKSPKEQGHFHVGPQTMVWFQVETLPRLRHDWYPHHLGYVTETPGI